MLLRRVQQFGFWATMVSLLGLATLLFALALTWLDRPFAGFLVLQNGMVDTISASRWTGFQHGIVQRDRVVAVEGRPLTNTRNLPRIVRQVPVGTVLHYTVERPEARGLVRHELTIPTQRFGFADFSGFFLTFWGVGLIHILIGLFVSVVKPGDKVARAHLFYCVMYGTFLMCAFDGVSTQVTTWFPHNPSFYMLGFAAVYLAMLLPRPLPITERFRHLPWALLACAVAFYLFAQWAFFQPLVWPTVFMVVLAVDSSGSLLLAFSALWARLNHSTPELIRNQANVILWGALVSFAPAVTYNTLAGAGITLPHGELMFFSLAIFPVVVAYTIVRHHLFDIEVIVKRTVTYAFVTSAMAGVYFVMTAGLRSLIHLHSDLLNVIATAAVALAFAPVRDRTKAIVDQLFFRGGYDLARLLTEFGDQARETFDATQLLKLFVKTIELALYPSYLAILLRDRTSNRLVLRESLGLSPGQAIDLSDQDPALAPILGSEGLAISADPVDVASLKEAFALPLRLKDELVGLILVGPRKSDLGYTSSDRSLLINLAQQLSLWVKNAQLFGQLAGQERLKRELEIAREVQAGLLPSSLPDRHGVELSAISLPALEVGGDFYDVLAVDDHRLGILIGDVSGKGAPAALLMAMTLVIFRSIARDNLSAADVMGKANELIYLNRPSKKMFVTAFYAVYDPRDRSLSFANAGSPLPFGSSGRLEAKGMSLGVLPTIGYEEQRATLSPGELIVLYSDGAEDAINPESEQFGEERLAEVVAAHASETPHAVQEQILAAIRRFSDGSDQFDDITLVTMRAS